MKKIDVIKTIAPYITKEDLVTKAVGALWNDWWNYRPEGAHNTFFTGILGSVTSTALGLALALPHRRVVALDTDGSMLMNTGAMCTVGAERPANLTVIVLHNEMYESIGMPPTLTARNTDLAKMAEGAGCTNCITVDNTADLEKQFETQMNDGEMGLIVTKIEPGDHPWAWEDRKPTDGIEDKYNFVRYMEKLENKVIHPGCVQA